MAIAWTTVENALVAWVRSGSGLDAEHVFWAQQKRPIPSGRYTTLRVTSIRQVGQDWLDVEDADAPSPGAEIVHRARGSREVLLSLQCFAGAGTGGDAPAMVLDAVQSAARLPSNRDALNAAGVGVLGFGPVQSIDGVVGSSSFEPRATLQARLHLASEVSEFGTWVEVARLDPETPLTGAPFYVPDGELPVEATGAAAGTSVATGVGDSDP